MVAVRLRSGGALGRRHGRHALRGAGHVGIVPDDIAETVSFSGLPLQRDGRVRRCCVSDFRFADAERFAVAWDFDDWRRHELCELPVAELLGRRIDPSEYSVHAAAAANYPASNLCDLNPGTACAVERDAACRAAITVRFGRPAEVAGVLFFNGYMKSAETWSRHSRVDRMRITVRRENGAEQTVVSDYGSKVWLCHGFMPAGFGFEGLWSYADKISITPVVEYGVDWYADKTYGVMGSSVKVSEIRFDIESVAEGARYDDLCISEIVLFGL